VIELTGIIKRFPGVTACDQINLTVEAGTIHALVGENGAGKSTLMNLLYGLIQPDAGELRLDGELLENHSPTAAIARGIGMVHQHFMLVPTLTVAENVVLGNEPRWGPLLDRRRAVRDVAELAARYQLAVDPKARVGQLSVGIQQRVEILKVLYRGARILILDEPTAVLTPQEVVELFDVLRRLKAKGTTIIIITHKLDEVMRLSDRVTVLRHGRVSGSLHTSQATREGLARLMVGRDVLLDVPRTPSHPGEPRLCVAGLTVRDARGLPAVRGVDFQIRAGEILGIVGVEGNGQSELVEALTGLRSSRAGTISVDGEDLTGAAPSRLHAAGVGHIPEDRRRHGLVLEFDLAQNLILGRQADTRFWKFWLRPGAIRREAVRAIDEYDVRPGTPEAAVSSLSGGNQQKLVLAREFSRELRLLIASQPTRGVDIGAIAFIHQQILAARDRGVAVLLVSAELDEVLALSDRIAVIYEGRLVGTMPAEQADRQSLGLMMSGASA